MYAIEISRAALVDLATLRAFDRKRILDVLKTELAHTPTVAAGHRKMLRDLRPAWEHVPPLWQVRTGDYRVFYDADEDSRMVYVRRVIRKGTKTTGEIV